MGKIIVAGSINMDVVVFTKRHPQIGETIFGSQVSFIPGGKGSNQAVAASRLNGQVSFIGRVGQDAFGDTLVNFLKTEKLNTQAVTVTPDAPTGTALITVDEKSDNTIIVVSGSNHRLTVADVETAVEAAAFQPGDIAISVFEIPQDVIEAFFKKARAAGATTLLNPAPAAACSDSLRKLVNYFIVNETELGFFAGQQVNADDLDSVIAHAKSIRLAATQTVIVTLGAKGLVAVGEGEPIRVEGRRVEAKDTTAAGDCFIGALGVALAEGQPLKQALEFANAAAAISVTRIGASSSLPHRHEVDQALR